MFLRFVAVLVGTAAAAAMIIAFGTQVAAQTAPKKKQGVQGGSSCFTKCVNQQPKFWPQTCKGDGGCCSRRCSLGY